MKPGGRRRDIALDLENRRERRVAAPPRRRGEPRLAQELLGIGQRNGTRTAAGERPHLGPAHHDAIGGKGIRRRCPRDIALAAVREEVVLTARRSVRAPALQSPASRQAPPLRQKW